MAYLVDTLEKFVLVGLLGLLAQRLLSDLSDKPINLVFLLAETMVIVFVAIRRRASDLSLRPADWLTGFAGTFLPLLVIGSNGAGYAPGAVLMLAGIGISIASQLSLRQSFGVVAANRGVVTSGLYGMVRHPMYLGYWFSQTGFLLTNPTTWNAVVWVLWATCQFHRIRAEERVLSADREYAAFKQRVRFRLIPLIY